jgi:hypothetical protein
MRKIIILLLVCISTTAFSQELNCKVVVNAQSTGNENLQVFKTLEKQLTEFVTKTRWTKNKVALNERIDANFVITIKEYSGDSYSGTLQVQSSRPVYGASYKTPIYNVNDKDFSFQYLEFQNIIFNENQFESNLVSVIGFHIYMILGLDADSFKAESGDKYYKQAQRIVNFSQQEGAKGWKLEDGTQSRFMLVDNMLSSAFKEFRTVMYQYHRNGLDIMSKDLKKGKAQVANAILKFKDMNKRRPNSYLTRIFFDAKSDEITDIFTGGPSVKIDDLVDVLNRVAPTQSSKWRAIKF